MDMFELEKQIKEMPDRTLLELTARTTSIINEHLDKMDGKIANHEERIDTLEKEPSGFGKKDGAITAGIALGVSSAMTFIFKKLGIG